MVGVKGKIDKAQLKKALEAEVYKLTACCEDARKKGVQLAKEITLVFTIGSDGKVAGEILPKPPLASEALTKCLSQVVQSMAFPSPAQPVEVTVKLVLRDK
jgi:hypothetical protein